MHFGSAQRLHLFRCQRNFLTQTACPRFSNQIIFLITDATEITVFLYLIIIDKISEFLLPLPKVNQFGNEIDARLNRKDKARFQRNGKALTLATELRLLG